MKERRPIFYGLDEHGEPVAIGGAAELLATGRDLDAGDPKRVIARTRISVSEVSTVFLMVDHAWNGPPLLWETAIFTGAHCCEVMERCGGGREQAEAMHAKWVRLTRRRLARKPISRRRASSDAKRAKVSESTSQPRKET